MDPLSRPPQPDGPPPGSQERTFGMLCHLLAFAGLVLPAGGNILGPLILWLVQKDRSAFVDDQGRESVNFQITVTIAVLVSLALFWLFCIGVLLAIAVSIGSIVFVVIAAVQANDGVAYRYPFCLRFI